MGMYPPDQGRSRMGDTTADLGDGLPAGGLPEMRQQAAENAMGESDYKDVQGDGNWGYRVYADGRIKIISAPEGHKANQVLTGGPAYDAIMTEISTKVGADTVADQGGFGTNFDGGSGGGAVGDQPLEGLPDGDAMGAGADLHAGLQLDGTSVGGNYGNAISEAEDPAAANIAAGAPGEEGAREGTRENIGTELDAEAPGFGQGPMEGEGGRMARAARGPMPDENVPEEENPFMAMLRKYTGGKGE